MTCLADIDCMICIDLLEEQFNYKDGIAVHMALTKRRLDEAKKEYAEIMKCDHIYPVEGHDYGGDGYLAFHCRLCGVLRSDVYWKEDRIRDLEFDLSIWSKHE
jgi:hypothetical protein